MIPGPRRRAVYGMAYGTLQGVQSVPRIMRGAPVTNPGKFDVPLTSSRRNTVILQQQGRLAVTPTDSTGTVVRQAPMSGLESQGLARTLGGLESQGLARTLGSLGGSVFAQRTLGDDIEMPEECARVNEVLIAPGVCGPDPRKPIDPYASAPITTKIPVGTTRAPAASVVKPGSKLTPQLLLLGGVAVAAILYFGRK